MSVAVVWTVGRSREAWWKPCEAAVSTPGQGIRWHGLLGRSQTQSREETEASGLLSGAPMLLLFVCSFISNMTLVKNKDFESDVE